MKFKVRKGYKSSSLLIEFEVIKIASFLPAWNKVTSGLKAELIAEEDVWQNDENVWRYQYSLGSFLLSIQNSDLAFVMSDESINDESNDPAILAVADALVESGQFERRSAN